MFHATHFALSRMFFSFEGIDGSGKSTQARLLADVLRQRGLEVVGVREPGGTDLGERVRDLLLNPEAEISPRAELLMFSAARAQLVDAVIRPALDRGALVIADRFYDSSTAYQGAGRELTHMAWMSSLHAFATAGLSPLRTYLIDVSPSVSMSRRSERDADRMEQGDEAFYSRVRSAYLSLRHTEADRLLVLDGTRSVSDLHAQIVSDATALIQRTV